jgi:hypothetical protein
MWGAKAIFDADFVKGVDEIIGGEGIIGSDEVPDFLEV